MEEYLVTYSICEPDKNYVEPPFPPAGNYTLVSQTSVVDSRFNDRLRIITLNTWKCNDVVRMHIGL